MEFLGDRVRWSLNIKPFSAVCAANTHACSHTRTQTTHSRDRIKLEGQSHIYKTPERLCVFVCKRERKRERLLDSEAFTSFTTSLTATAQLTHNPLQDCGWRWRVGP